jgi:hypothetical protein
MAWVQAFVDTWASSGCSVSRLERMSTTGPDPRGKRVRIPATNAFDANHRPPHSGRYSHVAHAKAFVAGEILTTGSRMLQLMSIGTLRGSLRPHLPATREFQRCRLTLKMCVATIVPIRGLRHRRGGSRRGRALSFGPKNADRHRIFNGNERL